MKSQRLKDVVFGTSRPATRLNHLSWKLRLGAALPKRLRRGPSEEAWLNVGSGHRPLPGFVNIDINLTRKPDMWLDVRNGLPFPEGSVDRIYTCHTLEHFYRDELLDVLKEFHRVLRPGGGVRILVPSLELAIQAYVRGEREAFSTFPVAFESLGGRFMNQVFCDGQHRIAFDFSLMQELLTGIGFVEVRQADLGGGELFPREVLEEIEPYADRAGYLESSLIVEASKAR